MTMNIFNVLTVLTLNSILLYTSIKLHTNSIRRFQIIFYNFSPSQEYKNALEDLESEFQSQQTKIQELNQKLRDDQKQSDQANNAELEHMRTSLKTKDDEIFVLNKTLDDLEAKYHTQEEELSEKHKCVTDLEIILVDYERKLEDYEACKKELESALSIMHEQEIDYQMLKKECDQFKAVCVLTLLSCS